MSTSVGMISGASTIRKSTARPGGRRRASEYAPPTESTRTTATVIAVTYAEFAMASPSCPRLHASPMFPMAGGQGMSHGAR
jgi:hypothetical protein